VIHRVLRAFQRVLPYSLWPADVSQRAESEALVVPERARSAVQYAEPFQVPVAKQAGSIEEPFEPQSAERFLVELVGARWIEARWIEARWVVARPDSRPAEPGPLISSLAMACWPQAHSDQSFWPES